MTTIPIYQIDAFTGRVFGGNPAAVCPLDDWLPDETMQAIAAENNLAETAFFVAEGDANGTDGDFYRLRWFTPTVEVDLCGHATLASGHVILTRLKPELDSVRFDTRSGELSVRRDGDLLAMDFPALPGEDAGVPHRLVSGLGREPVEVLRATNYLAVFETRDDVAALDPDMEQLKTLHPYGVIATAPGGAQERAPGGEQDTGKDGGEDTGEDGGADFVSRYFAPSFGVPEDPVTGSAHCTLIPYWAARLGKDRLTARQISARLGELTCEAKGDRVSIAGRAVLYLEGAITV